MSILGAGGACPCQGTSAGVSSGQAPSSCLPALDWTLDWVKAAHQGQADKAGSPYWEHPARVMERCRKLAEAGKCGQEALHGALLHDVLEDTSISEKELAERFGAGVFACVKLLTRPAGMTYMDYVRHLVEAGNQDAVCVKWCDLQDNLDPERMALLPAKTVQSLGKRYRAAEALLLERAPWLADFRDEPSPELEGPRA